MEEYANETMIEEQNDNDGFLDGMDATAGAEPSAEPEAREEEAKPSEEPAEPAEQEKSPATIEVVYNKEKKTLTLEEARPFIEKGMNYDKIKSKLENNPERALMQKLADQSGKPLDEYMKFVAEKIEAATAAAEAEEVVKKYPEMPPELAREIGATRAALKALENKDRLARERQEEQERQNKPMQDFVQAYPDIKAEDFPGLPESVLDAFRNGGDPVKAMLLHEKQELSNKLKEAEEKAATAEKAKEKNAKNRESTVGRLGSDATNPPADPFLMGLFER